MHLHSHWPYIEHECGGSLPDHFLMAIRSFDNAKTVTPFILEKGDKRYGLFLHVEKGNAQAAMIPAQIEQRFYHPYYNFDPAEQTPSAVSSSLEQLLAELGGGSRALTLDDHIPQALVRRLQKQFDVSLEGNAAAGPVCAERVGPKHVVAFLASERDGANAVARKLLQKSRHREGLTASLRGHDDTRFARLEKAMEADGLSSVIVTSALNIQEVTGLPMRGKRRALAAIYSKDSGLWLISHGSSGEANRYSSFKDACNDLMADGRIGVEMDDMPAWMYASAGLGERDCVAADLLVRKWRDESTLPDLAFYILAARASVHAIEKALEFASRNLDAGRTEMDAYKVYLDELYGFVAEHAPALRVARTLTNFHSGSRTIFPSHPAPHPLERKINTLKIDAGCMIFDRRGTLLGCSDIARTLCLTKDGTELYELFRKSTVDRLMPACGDGADGKTIHRLAVEDLKPVGSLQNVLGRKVEKLSDFNRDVGHVLGKNNLSHLQFTASDAGQLRAGMIACCEYQWPLKEHTVSYEDTGLVTGEGGLNFTVD